MHFFQPISVKKKVKCVNKVLLLFLFVKDIKIQIQKKKTNADHESFICCFSKEHGALLDNPIKTVLYHYLKI